jgi:hypothetical protein
MTLEDLQKGFLWLAKTIYSEEVTKERRGKFKKMLKDSPRFKAKLKSAKEG